MNTIYEPREFGSAMHCRNIFNTNYLTDPQYEEFVSICTILNREIHKSGSFIEKFEFYLFAISKSEKYISTQKAESIIRDLFKELFGMTMDGLRKSLTKNFDELNDDQIALGFEFAKATLLMVEGGDKMPFHRAFAHQAALMANELSITDFAAKKLMSEQYEVQEGQEFYKAGKQIEDKFYRPQIEAEKRNRKPRSGFATNTDYKNE